MADANSTAIPPEETLRVNVTELGTGLGAVTGALWRTGANVIASVTNGKCVVPRDGIVFEQNAQLMETIKNPNIVLPKKCT